MRTTLDLDDAILRRAKERAAKDGRSLTSMIEEALRNLLQELEQPRSSTPVTLPTFGGSGTQLGIDVADPRAFGNVIYDDEDTVVRSQSANAAS